ncbi:transglycosylase SLT domain-containing protein [Rhabdochromatium marinum]|uniref:transglycosylase SLT domain-containing protein n=1 Tax=Rhabdochromatium marinum TaxID=48729 RepID=UPI0019056F85
MTVIKNSALAPGLTLTLAMTALSGCTLLPSRNAMPTPEEPRSVSAREYGYVRPAVDPHTLAQTGRSGRSTPMRTAAIGGAGDPWQRIRSGRHLGIPSNPRVNDALSQLTRKKHYLNQLANRASPYLHLILSELERNGLPAELALLPEIESRYNPRAVSPMRAAGLWQFMPYTGKRMGLEQNAWYDGRYDVLAATRGAIQYLSELNQTFNGDWALTLAAYNAGPARVKAAQRANKRAGLDTDYWSLDLPSETEHYVPKLLAVATLVQNPGRYGQHLPALPGGAPLVVVTTQQPVELAAVATASGLSAQALQQLNPALKKGRTRAGQTTHLLVPSEAAARLNRHLQALDKAATLAGSDRPSERIPPRGAQQEA